MRSLGTPLALAALLALLLAGITIAGELEDDEREAISSLKKINAAELSFRDGDKEQDGNLDYGMLSELSNTGLIDAVLGSGTRKGYVFEASYSLTTSEFLWWATASPEKPGKTGNRYFVINTAGVVYESKEPIKLDKETCQVPKGLSPAREPRRPRPGVVSAMCGYAGVEVDAKGCAGVTAGQVYVFSSRGNKTINVEIESKDEKELVYIGKEGTSPDGHTDTLSFGKTDEKKDPATEPKREPAGKETLTVSGVSFECEVLAVEVNAMRKGKFWVCRDRFPFVIRVLDTERNETILDLTEIKAKADPPAAACACGARFAETDRYCTRCGKGRAGATGGWSPVRSASPEKGACEQCGAKFPEGARFCSQCGLSKPK